MLVRLEYKASPYLHVNDVSVIGSFNDYHPEKGIMQKEEGGWFLEVLLPPGEHRYKFFINQEMKLNDPSANLYLPDESEELWSVIIIDENGQRLYNNEQYEVTVEEYLLSGRMVEVGEAVPVSKKQFHLCLDQMIAARFAFTNVTGVHEVTALWYEPNGTLHSYGRNNLYREEESNKPIYLWFWVPFDDRKRDDLEGLWTLKLLIDGSYVLEDQMTVSRSVSYQGYGRGYGLKRI